MPLYECGFVENLIHRAAVFDIEMFGLNIVFCISGLYFEFDSVACDYFE